MSTATTTTPCSSVNSSQMRSCEEVHVNIDKFKDIPIIRRSTPSIVLSRSGLKLVIIIAMLVIFIITIITPIAFYTHSNDKPSSSSLTRKVNTISTIPLLTTSFLNSTVTNTEADSSLSTEFSTDDIDDTISMESSIATKTRNSPMTTMTMVSPNLLVNPGAEEQLDGWMQTGSSPAIADSNGDFNKGYYPHSGTYCFAGGKQSSGSPSKLIQRINLLDGVQGFTENQIDSGKLKAFVSFYYQTWHNALRKNDIAKVDMSFRSLDTSVILGGIHTGELTCTTSNPGWCHYTNSTPIPTGTRSIHYVMLFYKNGLIGSNIDSYIDDNSLTII